MLSGIQIFSRFVQPANTYSGIDSIEFGSAKFEKFVQDIPAESVVNTEVFNGFDIMADTDFATPTRFKLENKNEGFKTETIDRLCEYLKVQPSDIMEWIPNEEYEKRQSEKQNAEKLAIEQQIAELQAKLKQM